MVEKKSQLRVKIQNRSDTIEGLCVPGSKGGLCSPPPRYSPTGSSPLHISDNHSGAHTIGFAYTAYPVSKEQRAKFAASDASSHGARSAAVHPAYRKEVSHATPHGPSNDVPETCTPSPVACCGEAERRGIPCRDIEQHSVKEEFISVYMVQEPFTRRSAPTLRVGPCIEDDDNTANTADALGIPSPRTDVVPLAIDFDNADEIRLPLELSSRHSYHGGSASRLPLDDNPNTKAHLDLPLSAHDFELPRQVGSYTPRRLRLARSQSMKEIREFPISDASEGVSPTYATTKDYHNKLMLPALRRNAITNLPLTSSERSFSGKYHTFQLFVSPISKPDPQQRRNAICESKRVVVIDLRQSPAYIKLREEKERAQLYRLQSAAAIKVVNRSTGRGRPRAEQGMNLAEIESWI